MLDAELMLQHDHVTLMGLILHLALEGRTQGVKRVTTGGDLLLGGEEADPAQTSEDTVSVIVAGEGSLGGDSRHEVLLVRRGCTEDLARGFVPGNWGRGEEVARLVGQEANVNQHLDHLREALVAQGAADNGLGFGDLVAFTEGRRVTVGVGDEGEARVDVVGLGRGHQVRAGHAVLLAVQVELGCVAQGEQHATAGPRELVAQWVVRVLGRGETSAV